MFTNLVANLAYSPSVLSTVGFYIIRLKKEGFTRKLGLIFSAIAITIQSFILISPPQPTIAAGPNNIIYSGVISVEDMLNKFDQNNDGNGHDDLQAIFAHYGISREDIASTKIVTIKSTDQDKTLMSIGRKAYDKEGELVVPIPTTETTVFQRYLWSWDSGSYSTYKALQGTTADGRWFAVLMSCGNIVVDQSPPAPQNPIGSVSHDCSKISGWAYDPDQPEKSSKISVSIRLDGETEPTYKIITYADLPNPEAPVKGNHGFSVTIPEDRKSSIANTIYTAIALETYGGGEDTALAKTTYIKPFCLESIPEPESEPEPAPTPTITNDPQIKVCNIQSGAIEYIKQSLLSGSTIYTDSTQCEEIKVCQDNQMVTIKKYEYTNQPKTCPIVQVCRDGIIINTTSDLKTDADLEPKQCQQIEVCRDHQLITINKYEELDSDKLPDPNLICDDPFPIIVYTKTASNQSQDIADANGTTAKPGDIIEYSLRVENIGTASGDVELTEDLADVTEYADIIDSDNAQINNMSGILSWNDTKLGPDQTILKTIKVKIKNAINPSPSPENNYESNNLELRNVWHGNTVVINVPRPVTKIPEQIAKTLPKTGPSLNIMISFSLIMTAVYFYTRNRQLAKELKYIKREFVNT